ncbi:trafficking kinesin-binding protein 1-like isoform X3 [Gigantopelta aegis]|uniref:trafficking kinesin-binding protein 1-like isoform X3 n=1 Tax=Gigantopelta aegis TaxID=1735272 RepID=UPI001B88A2F5|nr:trafficking kinesin-binding protein 1-like isoform X3 [Gigantopelta aegis]
MPHKQFSKKRQLITCGPGTASLSSLSQCFAQSDKLAAHDTGVCNGAAVDTTKENGVVALDEIPMSKTRDVGVVTDVCNSADEVEIVSLIEEQIPRYRLRADTTTQFGGYNHKDWIIQTPIVPPDLDLTLTDEQIGGTLDYFVLCGDRLTQMTKTYNDIEAVTHLLEEKERDLELAARIGQTLLEKNKELVERQDLLEESLAHANEKANQLRHDLSMKEELLRAYFDDDSEYSDCSTPGEAPKGLHAGIELLQKKVIQLEEDNVQLRLDSTQLKTATSDFEEKEKKLVEDCLQQMAEVNIQVDCFAEELERKTEESTRQKEEIRAHLAKMADLQKRVRNLTVENMELSKHLHASQECQRKLTKELGYQHDQYDELMELLTTAQEELKTLRVKQRPGVTRQYLSSSLLNRLNDSLASELETSIRQEQSPAERRKQSWKIFETARAAKKASSKKRFSSSTSLSQTGADSSDTEQRKGAMFSFSDTESVKSDGYSADNDSIYGSTCNLGRPGIPGSNDLEASLKRLALQRSGEYSERSFLRDENKRDDSSRFFNGTAPNSTPRTPNLTPKTPDSIGSGYSYLSMTGSHSNPYFRIPEKLQIIKPMEGSLTLKQWQQLATPNLEGIFEERPGVQIKGERKLNLDEEVYRLSDFEEDDEPSISSQHSDSGFSAFSTTDLADRRKPDNHFPLSSPPSCVGLVGLTSSPLTTATTTAMTSTPRCHVTSLTGGNASAYGMSLGLAAILNERDLGFTRSTLAPGLRHAASIPTHLHTAVNETSHRSTTSPSRADPVSVSQSLKDLSVCGLPNSSSTPTEGAGILEKIKKTGFSLYGYIGRKSSADKTDSAGVSTTGIICDTDQIEKLDSPVDGESKSRVPSDNGSVLGMLTSFRRGGFL